VEHQEIDESKHGIVFSWRAYAYLRLSGLGSPGIGLGQVSALNIIRIRPLLTGHLR
jgi:hypothetical protein